MEKNKSAMLDIKSITYVVIIVVLNLLEQVKLLIKEVMLTYVLIVIKKNLLKSKVV